MAQLHRRDRRARRAASPTASVRTVADVDCEGETSDGRAIAVNGTVTRAVAGACVRGDLTARAGGTEWFRVSGLGDCGATSAPHVDAPPGAGPTTTVTVTETVHCRSAATCGPEGK
ncbi:hypothetical protein GCM10020295_55560 [Streptomyces cinereospinus]